MRDAAETIEDCAKRHGNVLANPAPLVLFEDFGDSAQLLTLYFWVELSDKVSAAQVASDLRFIIDKRLAEAGIVVAFPQRERAIRCRPADQGGGGRGRGRRGAAGRRVPRRCSRDREASWCASGSGMKAR